MNKSGARHGKKDREIITRSHRSAQQIAADMEELGAELEEAIEEATDKSNALKFISKTDNELRVANHIILFGGTDLQGEHFTERTKYESAYTKSNGVLVDWEHGYDEPDGDEILGRVDWSTAKTTNMGVWVERVLNRSNQYMRYIEPLIEEGIIGTSSEAVAKGVRVSKGEIQVWPIRRDSLTVQPAEPRMLSSNALAALKSLADLSPAIKSILAGQETGDEVTADPPAKSVEIIEVRDMTEPTNAPPVENDQDGRIKSLENKVDAFSNQVGKLVELLENSPAAKRAGTIAPDSETDHPESKSFGDFLIAVKRGNSKRLHGVYGSYADDDEHSGRKDVTGAGGVTGGYLIPKEYGQPMLELAAATSPIIAGVNHQPVTTRSGEWPALDHTITPTAGGGGTAMGAGVVATPRAEGGTATETQPTFEMLEWEVHSESGYVEVTKEMSSDSPTAIEGLLTRLFGVVYRSKTERHILRGSGVGQPLGILNANCTVAVTTATNDVFALADALTMISRFKSLSGGGLWIIHPSLWPDIGKFEVSSGSGSAWLTNLSANQPQSLLGYSIVPSEHMPQANNDDVILADLSAYWLFEKGGLTVSFSEHAAFLSRKDTWLFDWRNDGLPWLKSAITLADPTGSFTQSPFVFHDD